MPQVRSVEEFLEVLNRSRLVAPAPLQNFLNLHRLRGDAALDPIAFANQLIDEGLLTVFQAKQLLLGRHRGFDIGKYRLLEGLGTGGMSHVFLCKHKTMGHRVAIKILPDTLAKREPTTVERFFREARAVAQLNHPNIVRAHDIDRQGDNYYLVLDYVEGASLHDLVQRRGKLSPSQAADCIAQAALGLQHVHEAGLVHRDVKPGNLLIDRHGVVKILDLGLALFFDPSRDFADKSTSQLDHNSVLGTADYLAPEQAVRSSAVDIRADIYSLGMTFYYLLVGKAPFEDLPVAQKLVCHMKTRPPAPTKNMELLALMGKMIAKNPANRFAEPIQIFEALQPFISQRIAPPADSELPTLSKAATGPRTSRGRASLTAQSGTSIRRQNTSLNQNGLTQPPAGATIGPQNLTTMVIAEEEKPAVTNPSASPTLTSAEETLY